MFDAYFLLFHKKLKVIVSSVLTMKRAVTKVLLVALWLCEKPLVHFNSLLEKNELKKLKCLYLQ